MKRIILFSLPLDQILKDISKFLFFKDNVAFGYMPCDGASPDNPQYTPIWEELCRINNASLVYLDNTNPKHASLIPECDTLMITGGNTFQLLYNLRKNGFDKAVIELSQKADFALSGFSAGALVLTPTIKIINENWAYGSDENLMNLTDLTGLNILNYEVLPHFDPEKDKTLLEEYRSQSRYEVKTIANDQYLVDA